MDSRSGRDPRQPVRIFGVGVIAVLAAGALLAPGPSGGRGGYGSPGCGYGGCPTPTPTSSPPGGTTPPSGSPSPAPGPQPVLHKSVVVGVVSGTIRIKRRHGKFHTLRADQSIPLGSTVDTTKGKVRLTSASGATGATQSALFYKGAFVVTQTSGSKPVTQLALSGALKCGPKGSKASASASKKVRRLWGDGKGRFRTKGRHGAATVRGTKWLTEDRCDGTLVKVRRGVVAVRDFARRKTVLVKKGKSYLARAKVSKQHGKKG